MILKYLLSGTLQEKFADLCSRTKDKKNKHVFTYTGNLKNKPTNVTKQKEIHRYGEQTIGCQRGGGGGMGKISEGD